MLFKEAESETKIGVSKGKGGPTLDTQASGRQAAAGGRDGHAGRQPRLHRGDGALGLVHPQSEIPRTSPAAIPRWPWPTRSSP